MIDLLTQLREAKEGSRELDAAIAVAVKWKLKQVDVGAEDHHYLKLPTHYDDDCAPGTYWYVQRSGMSLHTAPHFTTSIDAARTLVSEGWSLGLDAYADGRGTARCWGKANTLYSPAFLIPDTHRQEASTPALAICIAAIEAMNE